MEFLTASAGYVVPFVVILTILVFVHEMGHFLVARRNGVRVDVFSIGFGPELFGFTAKSGTRWKISAIPLGGYVKMFGDMDAASVGSASDKSMTPEERAVAFPYKRVGQRAAIVAAGPAANFLFAIVLLAGLFMVVGQPFTTPTVDAIVPDSAAAEAGLQPGDTIRRIDGTSVERFEELQRIVQARPGEPLPVTFERAGQEMTVTVTPRLREYTDRFGNVQKVGLLGVSSRNVTNVRQDPATAIWQATRETWALSVGTLQALGQMIIGSRSTDGIGGVLGIAQMSGDVARDGMSSVVFFMALLSINLGLINLFPVPILDGGHLVFFAAEAVRGKPVERRIQEIGAMAGLFAVLSLMVFATWNDLVRLRVVAFFASLIG
jgi:regulator of sigma E protease